MTQLESTIYNYLQQNSQFNFSTDFHAKRHELKAVNELEAQGFIAVRSRTIGYVIADVI